MDTKEGYHFDKETGLTEGLPCEGVIVPSTLEPIPGQRYDAIVLGAGYAGLVAARDLATRGMQVLSRRKTMTTILVDADLDSIRAQGTALGSTRSHWGPDMDIGHRRISLRDGRHMGPLGSASCLDRAVQI